MLVALGNLTANRISLWDFRTAGSLSLGTIAVGFFFVIINYFVCALVSPDFEEGETYDMTHFQRCEGRRSASSFNDWVSRFRYLRSMVSLLVLAFGALVLVNLWTMLRFWQDKKRALARERRIPESDLLGLALIGGSPGALLARHLFRHKTRKEPFSTQLWLIVALQAGLCIGLAIAYA